MHRQSELVKTVQLWDLGEYKANTHMIRTAIDLDTSFRRYDCSLHEGWYCCRFIVMRMTHDKFGTGRSLLVYADSVQKSSAVDSSKPFKSAAHAMTRLGASDYDAVLSSSALHNKLVWVKYSGAWCPPCRLLDAVIIKVSGSGGALPPSDYQFFEGQSVRE